MGNSMLNFGHSETSRSMMRIGKFGWRWPRLIAMYVVLTKSTQPLSLSQVRQHWPYRTAGSDTGSSSELIIELAATQRQPAVYPFRSYAADGGLLTYGVVYRTWRGGLLSILTAP